MAKAKKNNVHIKDLDKKITILAIMIVAGLIGAYTLGFSFAAKGGGGKPGGGGSSATWCRDTTLTKKSSGECVTYAQQLANHKYAVDPDLAITGIYDAKTEMGIKQIQEAYGLRASGKVDDKTWRIICYSEKAPDNVEPGFDVATGNAGDAAGCTYGVGGK